MSKYVLDSSALIAYLVDEEGATAMEGYLKSGVCMSTVNWAEVLSKGHDLGKNVKDLELLGKERGLSAEAIKLFPLTVEDAKTIGYLRTATKKFGLSLGDRACLALAIRLNLPVITADRAWLKLQQKIKVLSIR